MDGSYDYMGMVTRVGAFRDAILHASGDLVPFYYEQGILIKLLTIFIVAVIISFLFVIWFFLVRAAFFGIILHQNVFSLFCFVF